MCLGGRDACQMHEIVRKFVKFAHFLAILVGKQPAGIAGKVVQTHLNPLACPCDVCDADDCAEPLEKVAPD